MDKDSVNVQEWLLVSSDFDEEEHIGILQTANVRTRHHLCWWTWMNALVSMILVAGFVLQSSPSNTQLNEDLQRISSYSPISNEVAIPITETTIDGGIAKSSKYSIARLPPGPEADAAWHRFEDIKTVALSEPDIIKLGKDPRTAVRLPDKDWHLGDATYMGQLDVVHRIHCLNQLRKRALVDYSPNNQTAEERLKPEWYWVHLQHCVSILLENLMCNANTEMLTLNWIEEADYPFPDFNVNRQCRDFEALMQWQEARAVDTKKILEMKKSVAVGGVIPGEAEWWALFDGDGNALSKEHHHGYSM